MQNVYGFDLEIADITEEPKIEDDLGVTCAGLYGNGVYTEWFVADRMAEDQAREVVKHLLYITEDPNNIICTVNGVAFDFPVLAHASGMYKECAEIALNRHADFMLMAISALGWRVGLDSYARGAKIPSKLKNVTLSNGERLEGISGKDAPQLWQDREFNAVLAYLRQDCKVTYSIGKRGLIAGNLYTVSGSGRRRAVKLDENGRLPTVYDVMQWDHIDNTWMDGDPPDINRIAQWAIDLLCEGCVDHD